MGANVSTPGLEVKGSIHDIEMVTVNEISYALLAMGDEGIAAVNITDPTNMTLEANASVNFTKFLYFHPTNISHNSNKPQS